MTPVMLTSVFSMLAADACSDSNLCAYFLRVLAEQLEGTLAELAGDMEADELFLVRGAGGYYEFFSLPQRVTLIAAWALSSVRIHELMGLDHGPAEGSMRRVLTCLYENYVGSFQLMSEKQAPSVVIISVLAARYAEDEWARNHIGCLYNSYQNYGGKVARCDLPGRQVFSFLRHRLSGDHADYDQFSARPSEALFALLAHYWLSNDLEVIRFDLVELDGTVVGTFVPHSYRNFSSELISEGSTIYFKFGSEVFTIADLSSFFECHVRPQLRYACQGMDMLQSCVALIASLVFPDRVPWHLVDEATFASSEL